MGQPAADDRTLPAAMMTIGEQDSTAAVCGNCRTPLAGPHCHVCGQPTRGLIRPLSGWVADFFDSVFDWDGRLPRTLVPLLLRPGHLTREYIAGRRVRYVTPVRMFLFLTIALFLALRWVGGAGIGLPDYQLAPAGEDLPRVERIVDWLPEAEREAVFDDARNPPDPVSDATITFGDWHPERNPVVLSWLSDGLNARLNDALAQIASNTQRINRDPAAFVEQMLSVAPQTLFFMLPVFALLLKLLYLLKRRLYMEHLLVALHSHSFIALNLLLVVLLGALDGWPGLPIWLGVGVEWLMVALIAWIPIYLLLMQKRVYGQGWLMTGLKYMVIGTCYVILLTFGSLLTLLLSLLLW